MKIYDYLNDDYRDERRIQKLKNDSSIDPDFLEDNIQNIYILENIKIHLS